MGVPGVGHSHAPRPDSWSSCSLGEEMGLAAADWLEKQEMPLTMKLGASRERTWLPFLRSGGWSVRPQQTDYSQHSLLDPSHALARPDDRRSTAGLARVLAEEAGKERLQRTTEKCLDGAALALWALLLTATMEELSAFPNPSARRPCSGRALGRLIKAFSCRPD